MKAIGGGMGNPGLQREAKLKALQEVLQMLGDMEAEPFFPKGIKAVKVDVLTKKPMSEIDSEAMTSDEGNGEENPLELEADVKGQSLEELKAKLAMLLK